jgi:hypothetical protein
MMAPLVAWSVRARGWARRRLLRGRGRVRALGSGSSPSPGVGRGGVRRRGRGRVRALGSGEAKFVVFRGRSLVRALGRAEFVVFRGRSLVRALGRAEFVVFRGCSRVRALGRARRSFLWCPKPDLAAVSLTLSSGTVVGATQAGLSPCQASQWSGEVTAVASALSTEERASG